jgi:thiamine pyrophosphate-dependent acetolactate synthase large subunit-like protein
VHDGKDPGAAEIFAAGRDRIGEQPADVGITAKPAGARGAITPSISPRASIVDRVVSDGASSYASAYGAGLDQGAIVRPYVKWDAQPSSPAAAREALFRAACIAGTAPMGPVYVNLDLGLQEDPLPESLPVADPEKLMPRMTPGAPERLVAEALAMLEAAERPVILMGRVSRNETAWAARLALAETIRARVITDLKVGAAFPTDHRLHAGSPGIYPVQAASRAIAQADVILSLDWVDLGGTLRTACNGAPEGRVIQVSLDHTLHNGWSMDHQALPPVDLFLAADPDQVAIAMLGLLKPDGAATPTPT